MEEVHFSDYQEVEVRSEEEGFKDSWYAGKVIRTVATPKSSKKKKNKVLIEYETLVNRDGTKALREYVDVCNLRPRPPQEKNWGMFRLNEVVDAYYNDGWWMGVVIEILENSSYAVFFRGSNEVIKFGAEALRVHLEWINGRWVRPQQQEQQTMEPRFKQGTPVEISLDDESCRGAWFPATVLKELTNDSFFVQYKFLSSSDEPGQLTETVDSLHIRPSPPQNPQDRSFCVSEEVEAFYHFAWWSGSIIEILADNRHIVFVKTLGELKEFKQSELRLNVNWINGEWIQESQLLTRERAEEDLVTPLTKGGQSKSTVSPKGKKHKTSTGQSEAQGECITSHSKGMPNNIEDGSLLLSVEHKDSYSPPWVATSNNHLTSLSNEAHLQKSLGLGLELQKWSMAECSFSLEEHSIVNHQNHIARGDEDNDTIPQSNKAHLRKSLGLGLELQKSCMAKCSFGLEEHSTVGDQRHIAVGDEENDTVPQPNQIGSTLENASLPFIKSSPLWETIESMEAFRLMPQKPHFHPLEQVNEELREGLAIGHMLNFAMLVAKICKVQFDEPRSVLENKVKALSDFEAFGFNIGPLQARLEELLGFKNSRDQHDEKVKALEEEIVKEKHEKDKLKADVDEIQEKLRELEESITQLNKKRKFIDVEMDIKSSNIGELQKMVTTMKEKARCIKLDFDMVAAAPW